MSNINKKREEISSYVFDNLEKNYKESKISFYECPTGSGKTGIILKSAYDLMKKYNTSVIISTSSNELALNFFNEGIQDVKKYYDIDIDPNREMEIIFGKSNFIDIEAVEFMIKSDFDNELSRLDLEKVKEWYNDKSNKRLTEKFVRDFNIDQNNVKYICLSSEDETDEVATIKNFPKFLELENKIYITNHLYLITLIEVLNKNPAFKEFREITKGIPMFLDEAHYLKKLAALKYTSNFSPFRLKNLFSELTKGRKLHKKERLLKDDIYDLFGKTINTKVQSVKHGSLIFEKHFELLSTFNEKYQKSFQKLVNGILVNKEIVDKNKERILKKYILREFFELVNIFYTPKKEKIELQYSAKKGYLKVKSIKKDPKFELKRNFWSSVGNVTLFSGTYRVNPDDTTPYKNKWMLSQLGLFKHSEEDTEEKALFNARISKDINFKVFKWLFPRENLKYTIVEDNCLQPRKGSTKKESEDEKRVWAKNIVQFYTYYKNKGIYSNLNILILVGSYLEANTLQEEFKKYVDEENIFYEQEKINTGTLLKEYKNKALKSKGNILIGTLTFYTGINLHGDLCDTIFMTKLPYAAFNGLVIANKKDFAGMSARVTYENEMVLTFRQGIGRGSRSENDKIILFIFDKRINTAKKERLKGFLNEMGMEFNFQKDFISQFGEYKTEENIKIGEENV